MIVKLISGGLILFTAFMGVKHGWQGLTTKPDNTGPTAELFSKINLSPLAMGIISVLTIVSAILILAPQTFVIGNVINAVVILLLMMLFFKAGEIKATLIEIPFLIIPLLLIWLKHPFSAN